MHSWRTLTNYVNIILLQFCKILVQKLYALEGITLSFNAAMTDISIKYKKCQSVKFELQLTVFEFTYSGEHFNFDAFVNFSVPTI